MSSENDDASSVVEASGALNVSQKKSTLSYTRDFLLSLSDLDICQKLPSGFDRTVLGEFEDTSHGIQDRPSRHGSLPLQGFRRNDYSSSPPTRGESSNYSRGVYGRWDSRSSGWSDKDSDSLSDMDSDSGRRYGNQSRRSWQNSEHDGLLGSGSSARPSGYAAGSSAPRVHTNDHYHLNRSNEPYHPPRPFKAVPHSRNNTNDTFNDETFGSSEITSQDRAEEERKRRASFELMRKEQQKVLQEKQKSKTNKHKDGLSDLTELMEDSKEDKGHSETNKELDSVTVSVTNNDSGKLSFPQQAPASRPLVPPGFKGTVAEKSSGPKSLISVGKEANPETEDICLHGKASPVQNGTLDDREDKKLVREIDLNEKHPEDKNIRTGFLKKGEEIVNSSSVLEVFSIPGLSELHETIDGEVFQLKANKVMVDKNVSDSNQENSTSILAKLFGSAPTVNIGGASDLIEDHDSKRDDVWSPSNVQSSKFAQWFHEDEKKPINDLSSGRPSDLLSLIVGRESVGSQVSKMKAPEHIPPEFSYETFEVRNKITSSIPSVTIDISEKSYKIHKHDAVPSVPVVLTCEDLEQTILSEHSDKRSTLQPSTQDWNISSPKPLDIKAVDNQASHHLLSLLQKGTGIEDTTLPPNIDIGSSEKLPVSELNGFGNVFDKPKEAVDKPKEANAENIQNPGQSLTLETLFGTAFMKELQSAEAPVSVQRGPIGSARTDIIEPHGLSLPVVDDGPFPSTVGEIGSSRGNHESNVLASSQKQPLRSDKIESWLRFDDPRMEMDSLLFQQEVLPKHGAFDGAVEIQLPEEESLITIGDSVKPHNAMLIPSGNSSKGDLLSSNTSIDIAEKLAALNSGFRGERSMAGQESHRFVRGPYDLLEPERQFQNLHPQASSPQIHAAKMSHQRRTLFHPLDPHPAHINSQMRFPDHITQHDTPPNHQFPSSMLRPPFHHPDTRVTGFDLPAHHQMLAQMQMPGNFPPPHLLHDFPRGSPVPPHPSNQATSFMQERDPMQGFPFSHRQPSVGGIGMPLSAPDASSQNNHPEAFQRLMEMELREKSKQMRPFVVNHSQGMYGHELDMSFRYR